MTSRHITVCLSVCHHLSAIAVLILTPSPLSTSVSPHGSVVGRWFYFTALLSTPLSGPDKPCQRRLRGLATCRVGVCRTRDRLPGIINTGYTAASQATRPACGCSDRRRRRRRLAGVRLQLCLYVVRDWCRVCRRWPCGLCAGCCSCCCKNTRHCGPGGESDPAALGSSWVVNLQGVYVDL